MKREYVIPEIEVITFDDGDILTTSLIFNANDSAISNEGFIGWGGNSSNPSSFDVVPGEIKNVMDI